MVSFGRYYLLRRLSVGGMAELFLGFDRDDPTRRPLVIKRILPQLADRGDVVRMFLDEGRLTSHLHHENLVQVYDVGKAADPDLQPCEMPFIAMEYVEGLSLSELVRRQPDKRLPPDLACWVMAEVCAGLAYAHERSDLDGRPLNIVHRDISPDNVLLSREGEVKLADFGIAKAAMQLARTRPGQVKGKLAYMSPEQLRSSSVDRRSDLFAVGLVLYEITVGKRPFATGSDVDMIRALFDGEYPPPQQELRDYPAPLARIVARSLEVELDRRYQSAADLRRDLTAIVRAAGGPARRGQLAAMVRAVLGSPAGAADAPATASFAPGSPPGSLPPITPTGARRAETRSLRPPSQEGNSVFPHHRLLCEDPNSVFPQRPLGREDRNSTGPGDADEIETRVVPAMANITHVDGSPAEEPDWLGSLDAPDTLAEPDAVRRRRLREIEIEHDEDTVRDSPSRPPFKPSRPRRPGQ